MCVCFSWFVVCFFIVVVVCLFVFNLRLFFLILEMVQYTRYGGKQQWWISCCKTHSKTGFVLLLGDLWSIHKWLLYNGYSLQPDFIIHRTVKRQVMRREGSRILNKAIGWPHNIFIRFGILFLLMLARDYDDPIKSLFFSSVIQKGSYPLCWLSW